MSRIAEEAERLRLESEPLVPVDLSRFSTFRPEPPAFVIHRTMPRAEVTLFGGHGGSGKSTMALVMAAHIAAGAHAWAGRRMEDGPVLYVSLEDPESVILWRLYNICEHYGLDLAKVTRRLKLLDGVDRDSALASEISLNGIRALTFGRAFEMVEDEARGVVAAFIDNASDAFDANANDPHMVRRFLSGFARVARRENCGVCILAHIDKAAARFGASGNSYTGSTAWHNKARARLALVEEGGRLELRTEKMQYGRLPEPVAFTFTDSGVPVPIGEGQSAPDDDRDAVLALFRLAEQSGLEVPAAAAGPNTALHALQRLPEFPDRFTSKAGRARFWQTVTTLQREGSVRQFESRKANRHARTILILASECASSSAPDTSPIPPSATDARAGGASVALVRKKARTGATDAFDADAYRRATRG
jgi:hypothetical protein